MGESNKSDSIINKFIKEMEESKNKSYLEIIHDYDPTSFVQYDAMLMLFAEYCKKVLGQEKIIEFKKSIYLQEILNDPEIRDLLAFKQTVTQSQIRDLIYNDSRVFKEDYASEVFNYHMGYTTDGYNIADAIQAIKKIVLSEEEEVAFREFQLKNQKEEDEHEKQRAREYYLKEREKKRKRKTL